MILEKPANTDVIPISAFCYDDCQSPCTPHQYNWTGHYLSIHPHVNFSKKMKKNVLKSNCRSDQNLASGQGLDWISDIRNNPIGAFIEV